MILDDCTKIVYVHYVLPTLILSFLFLFLHIHIGISTSFYKWALLTQAYAQAWRLCRVVYWLSYLIFIYFIIAEL